MNKDIFAALIRQIEYVMEKSSYYQKLFGKDCRIKTEEDFYRLPFTTKRDILADQAENAPFGSNLCVGIPEVKRIHKTSGTTNRPVLIALTDNDIESAVKIGAKGFNYSGLTKNDIVVHCLNYNMWSGGYTDHQCLENAGAAVVPFGVGNSHQLIETILRLQATAIHCTPSYLSKLEGILTNDFGLKPADLNLKLGLFGAESGLQNPNFRKNIEDIWGLKAMNANYGMSEVLSIIGSECRFQTGLHFLASEVLYPELISETGEAMPIEKGVTGELVLTNLCKEAQPLFRYRTGDVIKILGTECECGSADFRFKIVGRTDDLLVIKGLNVFVGAIDDIINKNLDLVNSIYQLMVSKEDPIEQVILKVEVKNSLDTGDIKQKLEEELHLTIPINIPVEVVQDGTLPRSEGKTKKVFRIL